jgi:putative transport protein
LAGRTTCGAARLGYALQVTQKIDFVFLGLGVLAGIALGHLGARVGGVEIGLGTGGGCLLARLLFGWIRSRYPVIGSLPSAAAQSSRTLAFAPSSRRWVSPPAPMRSA